MVQGGTYSLRIMDVNRVRAAGNDIVKLSGPQYIVTGKLVFSYDSPCFPHADCRPALGNISLFKSGDMTPQKSRNLVHLSAAFIFRTGQIPDVRTQYIDYPRAVNAISRLWGVPKNRMSSRASSSSSASVAWRIRSHKPWTPRH